jgi:hypothetical protein
MKLRNRWTIAAAAFALGAAATIYYVVGGRPSEPSQTSNSQAQFEANKKIQLAAAKEEYIDLFKASHEQREPSSEEMASFEKAFQLAGPMDVFASLMAELPDDQQVAKTAKETLAPRLKGAMEGADLDLRNLRHYILLGINSSNAVVVQEMVLGVSGPKREASVTWYFEEHAL